MQTIHSLRSIHGNFSHQEIREADLGQILESCVHAANASARQSYSIVVLDDRTVMRDLFYYEASRALIFCLDFTRIKAIAQHLGYEFDNDDIVGFITATIDTMLVVQTAVIAAKSLGIDSLITNGLHRNNLDKVYEVLQLPQTSCFPLITVALGYCQQEPAFQKGRLRPEFLVHRGNYRLPTKGQLAQMVDEYDDHSKHLGLIDDWEQQGFRHYLDWFYTTWSGKPPAQKVATGKILEFQQRLARSGFWWPTC